VRQLIATTRRRSKRAALLPVVVAKMCLVEVAVRMLPLPKVSGFMGVPLDSTTDQAAVGPPLDLSRWQRGQLLTLMPVAAHWPFADGPCLRQALVTGHILRRYEPVLRLGVSNKDALQAHAWVEVRGRVVGDVGEYTPLLNR
jgi:transglutaminase superfamily protein